MKNKLPSTHFIQIISLISLILFIVAACTPARKESAPVTLKIAVLPILDALPLYVAQQEGYFEAQGLQVDFIPAASAAERDQIITAGQADGMINDAISTLFYNKDQVQIQIVRLARSATPFTAQYQILASAQSGIATVEGLKGVPIGISKGTTIEYVTDRLLQAEGIPPSEIQTVAVPGISDRMNLLASGELQAATLPDPLSSLALQSGAVLILDDTRHPEYGYSVISFRKTVIDQNPEAIKGFLAALEQAVQKVNADPAQWDTLLSEKKLVPAPLVGAYQIPAYPLAGIPSQAQWEDALAWAKEKGLLAVDVPYESSVTAEFLP